jgi:hypothetical protein
MLCSVQDSFSPSSNRYSDQDAMIRIENPGRKKSVKPKCGGWDLNPRTPKGRGFSITLLLSRKGGKEIEQSKEKRNLSLAPLTRLGDPRNVHGKRRKLLAF